MQALLRPLERLEPPAPALGLRQPLADLPVVPLLVLQAPQAHAWPLMSKRPAQHLMLELCPLAALAVLPVPARAPMAQLLVCWTGHLQVEGPEASAPAGLAHR